MFRFFLFRLLRIIPVGIGVVVIVASLIHVVPGDPAALILGDFASLEDKQNLEKQLGLDAPFSVQLVEYFKKISHFDLGTSIVYNRSVGVLIKERLPATIELAVLGVLAGLMVSLPLGVIAAVFRGSIWDSLAMLVSVLGVAMPNFWLGPLLIFFFSLYLGWLPVSERTGFSSYVLPTLTLASGLAAMLSRVCRNAILENINEDYVRTARSKGSSEFVILCKHVAKNAALPVVTVLGLQFGVLLTGAIITEKIFDWPGLGSLIVDALAQRDYPLVQGLVLVFSFTYIVVNLLTDLAYAVIDPRISFK